MGLFQQLFGFAFVNRENVDKSGQIIPPENLPPSPYVSPIVPINDDGAIVTPAGGGILGYAVDLDASARTEAELIAQYRSMAMHPVIDTAIENIVSEAITTDEQEPTVTIVLDKLNYTDQIKEIIREEFENVSTLLDFGNQAYNLFRRWYVDGRIYFHVIIDNRAPSLGIQELRPVDPRKLKKVREIDMRPIDNSTGLAINQPQTVNVVREYWLYNDTGFDARGSAISQQPVLHQSTPVMMTLESIAGATSGLPDATQTMILSYLHKAIKPLNILTAMEDAVAIYRIARAPERRVFYIDVGNMPHIKANEYMKQTMIRYKNKVTYDSTTGFVKDDRRMMTMLEDIWLPRRADGRGTQIDTLPGASNLDQIDDVLLMQKNLYKSLNIPSSRLDPEAAFNIGRPAEISRDEVLFAKFIDRLRLNFSQLFLEVLGKQLILKSVMTAEEWELIRSDIRFDYRIDNHIAELKESEIIMQRLNVLQAAQPFVGIYFSREWVKQHVLRQTEDEIEQEANRIAAEIQMYGDISNVNEPEA